MITIHLADSKEFLGGLDDNFVHSCVTDPPYELTSIVKRFGKKDSAPAKHGTDGRFSRLSKGFLGSEWDGTGIQRDPEFWKEVLRVMKPGGYLLSFGGTRTYHQMATAVEEAGFEIRDMIGWIYGQGFPKSHDLGNGWGTNLKPALEPIVMARKPLSESTNRNNMAVHKTGGLNIEESRIEGEAVPINKLTKWSGFGQLVRPDYEQEINDKGRWPSNLILDEEAAEDLGDTSRYFYCPKATKKEKKGTTHPTVKPIKLMEYLVKLVTPEGGIVLDPFMGSGSTGIACKNLGFGFIGIEREELFYAEALERIYGDKYKIE